MTIMLPNRTADAYFSTKYSASGTKTDRTTSPSYISKDWDSERSFERLAANYHAENATDATTHVETQHMLELQKISKKNALRNSKDILASLAQKYAFTWADLSRLIGVSVPAIRKWRMEGGVSPENVLKLAYLEAFAYILKERGVNVASWVSTPLVAGYTVAPKHLYTMEMAPKLLDLAFDGHTPRQFLDGVEPDWQARFDSGGFAVAKFDDGMFGITTN